MEREVLLAKLHVESEMVDHWVAVENSYTVKGEPKAVHLEAILRDDERFRPFLDRFTRITLDRRLDAEFVESRKTTMRMAMRRRLGRLSADAIARYRERPWLHAENAQRAAAWATVADITKGKGWLLESDVDEMMDASTPARRAAISDATANGALLNHLDRRRFVYDFDNIQLGRFRSVPLVSIEAIAAGTVPPLGKLRLTKKGVVPSPEPLVYEYSYCYGVDGIRRKLRTFLHTAPDSASAVDRALECNHAPVLTEASLDNHDWLETIADDVARHPSYIRENAERLRTHAVNPEYREARRVRFPMLFA